MRGQRRNSSSSSSSAPLNNFSNSAASSSTIIDAAALQNEMMKKYGLMGNSGISAAHLLPKSVMKIQKEKRQSRERKQQLSSVTTCPSCAHQLNINVEEKINTEYCEFCGYFLVTKKAELSLAQKRGLVSLDTQHNHQYDTLKPLDWYCVERTIQKKAEPDSFCPICMGPFHQNEEVLLSCGHIFHKICLRSFENFIKNTDLSCPICRYF
jgi:Zn ribbon nucleic-acid-binding protein